jgi:4-hydroxy-tetrahydrodipicolinate synthase
MATLPIQGAFTALVTPFKSDLSIDWDAFDKLVARQLEGKVSGVVPCGTTGECPTLSFAEQEEVVKRTVKAVAGRAFVLAGAGSNATDEVVDLAKAAAKAGANAIMTVMPYYNKPSQEGLFRHIRSVASAVDVPVVLYNVPGRTAVDLSVETTLRALDACKNVVAVKDASGNVMYCQDLLQRAGDRVIVMCGDDALTVPMMAVGAKGVISVTSNVYPAAVQEVTELMLRGEYKAAIAKHAALFPLHRALFSEPSPQPTKGLSSAKGWMQNVLREPMIECSDATIQRLLALAATYEAKP